MLVGIGVGRGDGAEVGQVGTAVGIAEGKKEELFGIVVELITSITTCPFNPFEPQAAAL
jgi:hypothetical protein